MYIDRVLEEDSKMVQSWKKDADGILVFVSFRLRLLVLLRLTLKL